MCCNERNMQTLYMHITHLSLTTMQWKYSEMHGTIYLVTCPSKRSTLFILGNVQGCNIKDF